MQNNERDVGSHPIARILKRRAKINGLQLHPNRIGSQNGPVQSLIERRARGRDFALGDGYGHVQRTEHSGRCGGKPLGDGRAHGGHGGRIGNDVHHMVAVGQRFSRDGHLSVRAGPWRVGIDSGPIEDNCGAGDIVRADVAIHNLNSGGHRSPSSH